MGFFSSISGGIKSMIKTWLDIQPAQGQSIVIQETLNHEQTCMRNRILYRGDPSEIEAFAMQSTRDNVMRARFWASRPSKGHNIRKIHSGLPSMIVNTLADIVMTDMLDVEIEGMTGLSEVWANISKENKFNDLVTTAIQEVLTVGDGAFKMAYDPDISELPIIEFVSGENLEYKFKRGRLQEIVFKSSYTSEDGKKTYILHEIYKKLGSRGEIEYKLFNSSNDEVDLALVPELQSLVPLNYEGDYLLCVPFSIYPSPKWKGRGQSIFDLKFDDFDALDETISTWQDAIRLGRIKRYIPDDIIPKDPSTGKSLELNLFDNQYVIRSSSNEDGRQKTVDVDQPQLDYNGYIGTYINILDLCLQGIISPSTLGIDTKKLDNAEAQREKEKTTLYTRNKIIDVLQTDVIPAIVDIALKTYCHLRYQSPKDVSVTVEFGEYANPSFEAQVETVGKAAGSQIMSIEAQVETLWGDSKEDDWKKEEIQRIKAEKGIAELEEPMVRPNGFAEEEALNGLDRLDNRPPDRNGNPDVPKDGADDEKSQGTGSDGAEPLDAMASNSGAKPKTAKERAFTRSK